MLKSFFKGFGKNLSTVKFNTPDWEYLQNVKYNQAVWQAFKQSNEIIDASKWLVDEKGNVRSYENFRKAAETNVTDRYNKRWLLTEYNQAHQTAIQARIWKDLEVDADLYPNLIYIAVMDDRTRQSHAKLNGTILPFNHIFWNKYAPPNGWGCRCTLRNTDAEPTGVPASMPDVPREFQINPGKSARIFSSDNPYAVNEKQKAELLNFVRSRIRTTDEILHNWDVFNAFDREEYTSGYFDGNTGGYYICHKDHKFSSNKPKGARLSGGDAEKEVGAILASQNKTVTFVPELDIPSSDMIFDDKKWDIKYLTAANGGTIRKYIRKCMDKADCIIFYCDDDSFYNAIKNSINRDIGAGKQDRMPSIFYLNNGPLSCIFNNGRSFK